VTPEDRARLKALLSGERLLALGVVVDMEPVVGLVPYACAEDYSALYIQASRLAHHSQGLKPQGAWAGVIHEPDSPDADPLQIARLVIEGHVTPLTGDSPEFATAARAFVSRFPGAAMTLPLPDFALCRLELAAGRLILGFGAALNISRSHFEDLAKH
jgi:uncharacterized protein YhbP (UPF0306 family)